MRALVSDRSQLFTESVIREMTRLCLLYQGENGINLAQGFPDFPAPQAIKDVACKAIQNDINQYAITWGAKDFRDAVSAKVKKFYGLNVDPEKEITVCCGSTEAMISSLLAIVNPGDEVIVMAPYYENYWPDTVLAGARPRFISLHEPDWHLDPDELGAAFNEKTKAIIINTPNNPTGKVFSRKELELIAGLCQKWNAIAVTDEIYEHIFYAGEHIPIATLPGMWERTITVSGLSKTYSITGWRLGYAIASAELTDAIRKVHDFVTVGAAAPLQAAGAVAMALPDEYYTELVEGYKARREMMLKGLTEIGFRCYAPDGAYYIMTDITTFGYSNDVQFAQYLVKDLGVAVVPGSSFYYDPEMGRTKVRFCFSKRLETIEKSLELLSPLKKLVGAAR